MVNERTALAGLAMATMVAFSVVVAGMAVGAPGVAGNTGAGNAPADPDVANFTDTSPMTGQQVDPSNLAGKLRVESQYADDVTIELVRNSSSNFTLAITGPADAENVSFYVQTRAFASSQNVSNVTATLDGENISVTRTEAVGQHWVSFNIDHFSTRYVTLSAEESNGTGGPPDNETGDNETTGPPDNVTDGNQTGPPENGTGMPAGVANFTDTSPMSGTQVQPPSLAGKLRVENQYADNVSVELERNSSSNFTLAITADENASNVTFYLQKTAFANSQNVTNVTATLDGEPIALGRTDAQNSTWIAFEIDHFSTRYVTFETSTTDGSDGGPQGPPALPSASNTPIDADGDGVFEDVNGDGDVTPGDATVLFDAVFDRSQAISDYPAAFDVNGDGEVTVGDASVLFDQAFESSQ